MIVSNGKYYLYRHIRLDKNEPFYIGIGTKSKRNYTTFISKYYRAHRKDRNPIWQRIVSKTSYKVEILLESDDYLFIKQKEIEFIKLYGKKEYFGTLVNLTDGGDGTLNHKKPESQNSIFSKPIYQYSLDGIFIKKWFCAKDVERELHFYSNSLYDCCNGKNKTAYGFQWSYKLKKMSSVSRFTSDNKLNKKVYQYDKNMKLIKEWDSAKQAADTLKLFVNSIYNCCNKKLKTTGNFKWCY